MINVRMVQFFVKQAETQREKIVGLIGKKQPYPLLLKTRFGIHTFGVRFPLDIIILNDQYVVTAIYENLKPNRIFIWNPLYQYVLELPAGTMTKKKIKIGTIVKLMIE